MSENIFLNYDQIALDQEYDNRGKVKDYQSYLDTYTQASAEARQTLACQCDIAYGDATGEHLDIFQPADSNRTGTAMIFVHGGYWRALSKNEHSFVAQGLTAHGVTTVVIDYDLMPAVRMDELVRQCRAAVAWTFEHAAELGVDRKKIYVSGHSAGGHLTAMVAATDWQAFAGLPSDTVKACCGLSGLYDLEPIRLCFLNDDLAMDESEAARNSPMATMPTSAPPMLALVGSDEGPEYLRQSNGLAAAWSKGGHDCEAQMLDGLNHFSIAHQMANPESQVTKILLKQMGLT